MLSNSRPVATSSPRPLRNLGICRSSTYNESRSSYCVCMWSEKEMGGKRRAVQSCGAVSHTSGRISRNWPSSEPTCLRHHGGMRGC